MSAYFCKISDLCREKMMEKKWITTEQMIRGNDDFSQNSTCFLRDKALFCKKIQTKPLIIEKE